MARGLATFSRLILTVGVENHQSYNIPKNSKNSCYLHHIWYTLYMVANFRLQVVFYKSDSGKEPVRDWLKKLDKEDRKVIGEDIKTVQFGWPLGMPLVRKIEKGLWEVRIQLDNRIARILFTAHEGMMILLHGFIKKSQRTPANDLKVAKQRMGELSGS